MRFPFRVMCLFCLLCLGMSAFAQTSNVINVVDFGAIPDDRKDDTTPLRKAAEYCRKNPNTTLIIPPGVYQLRDAAAEKLEQDIMNGKYGADMERIIYTPYYPYVKGLDFVGAKDLNIQANGAILTCEGWMEPVSFSNCERVSLTGLTIDYKRKPFSEGIVTTIEDDYFDVQFRSERTIKDEMPFCRATFWMKDKNRLFPEPIYFPKKEILKDNKVRIHQKISKKLQGAAFGVNHSFHFRPAILVLDSRQVLLNNVTIHSQPGMGVVGFDSEDITLNQVAIIPAPGSHFSTNTDATHFACCKGLVRFDGCRFQAQGDDATNVHGYYQTITRAEKNEAVIQVKAGTYTHAQVLDAPEIGDELELVEISTLKSVRSYTVEKVIPNRASFDSQVTLSDTLPDNYNNYYLMNITKLPRVEFENCIVNSHLARGILIKTRDVLVKNNVFRHCTGTAIHIGAEANWHEGSHAKNVTVTDNIMIGCGSGAGGQGGASAIAVIIEARDVRNTYLHQNITIKNNTIIGEGNHCGIYVANASQVVLENNSITNCQQKILMNSVTGISIKE